MKTYYVYILTNKLNRVLYIGVTSNLEKRLIQHRAGAVDSFTNRYNVHKLVYYEKYSEVNYALKRERRLKKWKRKWKLELVEKVNPSWVELTIY